MTRLTNPFMHFEVIKDYRQTGKVTHKLSDIICKRSPVGT
jgi:hypothetical protein